jgi:hypothetical protein
MLCKPQNQGIHLFFLLRKSSHCFMFSCNIEKWIKWEKNKLSLCCNIYPCLNIVFFFFNLWCCHTSNHSQKDLATFDDRLVMKVEIYESPSISWLLAWTMCFHKEILKKFLPNFENIQHNIFFWIIFLPKAENLPEIKHCPNPCQNFND